MVHIAKPQIKPKSKKQNVPDYLVREIIYGERWFYRGYREVLAGLKKPEEIMACSSLQSVIVGYINNKLYNHLEDKGYWVLSNEIGNKLPQKDKAGYDVAVFDEATLPPSQINIHYPTVLPRLVVEVDLRVEAETPTADDILIQLKTQRVLDFGAGKVIWFFTKSQKVLIAEKNKPWTIDTWDKEVELWEGLSINIASFLSKKGINPIDIPNASS